MRRRTMRRCVAFALALTASTMMSGPAAAAISISSDPILYWNDVALTFFPGGAPVQTRAYAMINAAMHDAVNAASGSPNKSYIRGVSSPGGDLRAASSKAARDVLVGLNAGNTAAYDAALTASLALVPDGQAKIDGLATGSAYAAAILGRRAGDGSANVVSYTTSGLPGDWRPTAMGNPAVPQWGSVDPFLLTSGDQFRPVAPPTVGSAAYAAAYNEVKDIGSATSGIRTADQTASALFWDAAAGGPWLRIGVTIAEDEGLSTLENARAFALLSSGLADAIIAGFDAKYTYRLWRPATAITLGDSDGNVLTAGDAGWTSLFSAPLHPSYISTHSALSGAGSTILSGLFGDDEGFTLTIAGDTRSFTNVSQAALDGANSRLWGGIHFGFDNEAGLDVGRQVGRLALSGPTFNAVPEPEVWTMLIGGFALVGGRMRREGKCSKAAFA